jgi:hypothetical protein
VGEGEFGRLAGRQLGSFDQYSLDMLPFGTEKSGIDNCSRSLPHYGQTGTLRNAC